MIRKIVNYYMRGGWLLYAVFIHGIIRYLEILFMQGGISEEDLYPNGNCRCQWHHSERRA